MELMVNSDIFTHHALTEKEFDACAGALSPLRIPLEQSPEWGNFDSAVAGRTFLGSFRYNDHNGNLIAIGSATLYKQKGRNWIWFKHGPLFATTPNTDTVRKMCATLRQQFASHPSKPLFIRLSSPTYTKPLRLPYEHTMYDETAVADLNQSEDDLYAKMSQSGRQGIRKAIKASVTVREITANAPEFFKNHCYPILEETGARDGFGIHTLTLYTTFLRSLTGIARLYVAEVEDSVAAWAITTEYVGTALYYYGASSAQARETSAAYALHWEIMKIMKARHNHIYDFMGIAGKYYPALKNVTQFKLKFTKNIVSVPTTYDLSLQSAKYHALALAIKANRRFR